jgi:hypothetical protein
MPAPAPESPTDTDAKPLPPGGHPTVPWDCAQTRFTRAWELGTGADQSMNLLAAMPGGDMIVAGDVMGQVDFGNGVVANAPSGDDLVVARIRPTGDAVWAVVGSGGAMLLESMVADRTGSIAVGGWFSGDLTIGAGTPTETTVSSSLSFSGFVLVLSPDGAVRWIRTAQGDRTEQTDALAFGVDGTVWATGSFSDSAATISYEEPDAITITGGDTDPNTSDAWLAHFDANGGLLGVGWSVGPGSQSGTALAARPTGGVDLVLEHDSGDVFVPSGGGAQLLPGGDGDQAIIRLAGSGAVEGTLDLPELSELNGLAYAGDNLVLEAEIPMPATIAPWDASPPVELVATPLVSRFDGLVVWQGGTGPVTAQQVDPYGRIAGLGASTAGVALALWVDDQPELFPGSLDLVVSEGDASGGGLRSAAIASDPSGTWTCAVDVEANGEELSTIAPLQAALDEAGGLWLAGRFRESTFTVEAWPGGPAAAVMEAPVAEDDQGFLVRWQLWPTDVPATAP